MIIRRKDLTKDYQNVSVLDRFWLFAFSSLIDAREAFLVLQITQNSI